ncbi:jmjc domain-containing protein 4 [Quercus suber]|uniref:Jmjc domain-containing protein 4 n=1 Tax=Quercus suber TaxID=58331 RepID=A0AAW0K7Z9_QUESU
MGIRIGGQIEKVNGKELNYSEFVERYMEKNQPVVLTGLMDDWKACKDWVFDNGKPNLHFFSTHFGNSRVQVADCGTREFTDQKRVEMSVSEFVDHWLENSVQEHCRASKDHSNGHPVLYLKDWHFVKEYPEYLAYTTPLFFCDDWLNLYLDNYRMHKDPDTFQENNEISCSDYRFVYMGAKGSWTPLHADVFRSYSWSANEDTISINHNWFNGYNLSWVWNLLLRDYNEAKEYIEDIRDVCDDFEGLCQRNLAANTGMNFYDFFIFITHFCLANLVQLCHLLRDCKNPTWSSSTVARHLALNLRSLRNIAVKINSIGGVAGSHGFFLDIRETLDDPTFLNLCVGLENTFGMIHKKQSFCFDTKKDLVDDLTSLDIIRTYGSQICTAKDLVRFIDIAIAIVSGINGEIILPSELDGA